MRALEPSFALIAVLAALAMGTPTAAAETPFADSTASTRGPYLGQSPPGAEPRLFAPGVVSTDGVEILAVFSPGGRELFFTRLVPGRGLGILSTGQEPDGTWPAPVPAAFSGQWSDAAVSMSPDGQRLWFVSNRPRVPGGEPLEAQDVWLVRRGADGAWTTPVRPDSPVNSDGRDLTPCETAHALFLNRVDAAGGAHEIVRVPIAEGGFEAGRLKDGALEKGFFGESESITAAVPLTFPSLEPAVPSDEGFMVFVGTGGPDDQGGYDLYVTFRLSAETWSAPTNLGAAINTSANEHFPTLTPDGRFLFFVSDRNGDGGQGGSDPDIYWVSTRILERLRPAVARPVAENED